MFDRGEPQPRWTITATYEPTVTYVLRSGARPHINAPAYDEHEPRELIATGETYEAALEQPRDQVLRGWVPQGIDRYLEQPVA